LSEAVAMLEVEKSEVLTAPESRVMITKRIRIDAQWNFDRL
jgi:hypothetical protein